MKHAIPLILVLASSLAAQAPWLGVSLETVKLVDGRVGLQVTKVETGSPAMRAGLEIGDVIVGHAEGVWNAEGNPLAELVALVRALEIGSDLALDVVRVSSFVPGEPAGSERVTCTLAARPRPPRLEELRSDLLERREPWMELFDRERGEAKERVRGVMQQLAGMGTADPWRTESWELARRSPLTLPVLARDLGRSLSGHVPGSDAPGATDLRLCLELAAVQLGHYSLLDFDRAGRALPPPAEGQPLHEALLEHVQSLGNRVVLALASCGEQPGERERLPQGIEAILGDLSPQGHLPGAVEGFNPAHVRTVRQLFDLNVRDWMLAALATVALRDWIVEQDPEGWELGVYPSRLGPITITGKGDDRHRERYGIVIDLGGNDSYTSESIASSTPAIPFSLIVDLGDGNDTYGSAASLADAGSGAIAAAGVGVALLHDAGGNDIYKTRAGIASAIAGVALLEDLGGDDTYHAREFALAAAMFGVALLLDHEGNDDYAATKRSMGAAGPGAFAALVDLAGDDVYHQPDAAQGEALMGFGFGLTVLGQGTLVSGGIGALVDARGNDTYRADGACMGVGTSLGLGVLWDGRGDDEFTASHWAMGFGFQGGVGALVDEAGDDRRTAHADASMSLGSGFAYGLGWLQDDQGNDHYEAGPASLACGRAGGLGALVDLSGADTYACPRQPLPVGLPFPEPNDTPASALWIDLGPEPNEFPKKPPESPEPQNTLPGLEIQLPQTLEQALEAR